MQRSRRTAAGGVACPRCGGPTRRGFTPLGRVCEDCSRHVFAVPSRDGGKHRSDPWSVIAPLLAFGLLVAVSGAVVADGLSSFDPVVLAAGWGTFVIWGLAPRGDGGGWLDGIRI